MPLPGGAAVDAPERQRTLRDTIAWSYQMIEPDEQAMLQRLSVFAGDFDLGGVEAVARDAAMGIGDAPDDLEILGRLVDRSLVRRVESDDEDRYPCWARSGTSRPMNSPRLGDLDGARSRHARYWLEVAGRLVESLDGPGEARHRPPSTARVPIFGQRSSGRWTPTGPSTSRCACRASSVASGTSAVG